MCNMKKIIIIGCPGSGKSTIGKKLSEITKFPLYHLDMIWHKPDRTTISKEEFERRLQEIFNTENWIIEGNYQRTIETRLKECDTAFLLNIPLEDCISGAKSRVGKKRDDMPWVETEFNEDFRKLIEEFSIQKLPAIYELLGKYKDDKKIIIFKSREEINDYIKKLETTI